MATLKVRVIPGARQEGIAGCQGDSLRVRVRARAERGRANQSLVSLLARRLGVAPASLTIVRGALSRDKLVRVDGLSDQELLATLDDTHR